MKCLLLLQIYLSGGTMRLKYCVLVCILLLASGCAGQQEIVRKQAEMESRLEFLAQGNKALTVQVSQLSEELRQVKDQVQNHSTSISELKVSAGKAANIKNDIPSTKEQPCPAQPSVTKIELINNDTKAKVNSDNSSAAYMKAFGLYSADNYPAAIEAFESYLNKYPDAEFSVNARYWIGECYYSMSDLPNALESFKKVVTNYPTGKKVPDAMLKIGYTQFAMKEPGKAGATLRTLIAKYPDSAAAAKAREKLDGR
jgi:tol-pal system protein YbgF